MTSSPSPADAVRIAEAVEQLPEVARLSGGPAGTVATYLPKDRVLGVRIHADGIEVHVVAATLATPLATVGDRVRQVVRARCPGAVAVDVFVDDIELLPPRRPDASTSTVPSPPATTPCPAPEEGP